MAVDASSVAHDLIINLGASAVWAVLVAALIVVRRAVGARRPLARVVMLLAATAVFTAANLTIVALYPRYYAIFLISSAALLTLGWWLEIRQFWRLGILGISSGEISSHRYTRALELCHNSLDFLGIGAHKLSEKGAAFEAAIDRCHREARPIRFLLCSPEDPHLQTMARQAGRPLTEYQDHVRASLKTLKQLRETRAKNISIRFYAELPVFRLMFVNDELCLASHYVFGEGDGSQVPDVYLTRMAGRRDVDSIYYGFRRYFEQLWERSEEWDYSSHVVGGA